MYFKLAKRNMHRSMKEYAIYFITLIFSIALFYSFNSVEDQKVFLNLDVEWENAFKVINLFLNVASVFVVFILAFLILYSNNYLIRRRKKELGIYLTLGMKNSGVSKILFVETFILGIVSLGLGLILGIFAAQILSVFTADLFDMEMSSFTFIFSVKACIKTIIAFGGIYLIVGLLNIISISKIKLIDLINANKKNEKIKVKNPLISVILFLISIILLGAAYYIVLKNGIAVLDIRMVYAIILGILGTFIFFMSLSGFILTLLKNSKNVYLKELNMFLIRQLNSKINSAYTSISFICIMLFLAICMLSSGLSLNKVMNKDVQELIPYNMTLYNYTGVDIENTLKENSISLNDLTNSYHKFSIYTDELRYNDLLNDEIKKKGSSLYPIQVNANVDFMKLSDLNRELKNLGKDEVNLKDNEFLIISNVDELINPIKKLKDENKTIKVKGKEFQISETSVINFTFYNSTIRGTLSTVVLNDEYVDGMKPFNSFLNFNNKNSDEAAQKGFEDSIDKIDLLYHASDNDIRNTAKGVGGALSFLAIYLGIIFIIASSAVLAIQQLSNTDDNVSRYRVLRKIGTEDSSIYKCVKREMGIYFGMPLILAIVHSSVGLKIANDVIGIFGSGSTIVKLMVVSALFIVSIYGTYYLGTYICAKNIIRKKS